MTLPVLLGPLRYMIGGNDKLAIQQGRIYEFSYDARRGDTAYGNLRDEKGRYHSREDANKRGPYAPYLPADDITEEYGEFCPDPRGRGFRENIMRQLISKRECGCVRLELDNPDTKGLALQYVLDAMDMVSNFGMKCVAKNPMLVSDPQRYVAHHAVDLVICEHDRHQGSDALDALRRAIGQPELAVRFVAFVDGDEDGTVWANAVADRIKAKGYRNMGVTISKYGEYNSCSDLVRPKM